MIDVAYSGHTLCRPMTGVGRYLQSLSQLSNNSITQIAFVPNNNVKIEHGFDKLVIGNNSSKLSKLIWSYTHTLISNTHYDIYHSPQMLLPYFKKRGIKKIVTIHDLLFLDMPFLYSSLEKMVLKSALYDALIRADYFICISQYTYSRFKKHFPDIRNVRMIYNCLPNTLGTIDTNSIVSEPYFILPSNRTPRKNIANTLLAYKNSLFYKNGYHLYICGPSDGLVNIEQDGLIHDAGYLSEVELKSLYKRAYGLLFFSLGEGFGYPIVEAASYGVPVLGAANTSILELFDHRKDLLCLDYHSAEGITLFLDRYFKSAEMRQEILFSIKKSMMNFQKEIFDEELLALYNL